MCVYYHFIWLINHQTTPNHPFWTYFRLVPHNHLLPLWPILLPLVCVFSSDPNAPPLQIINVSSSANSREPIPTIDALYSPKFPLEVVRTFVMEALHEAVDVNQVHNRDPIGWSNENLFLYVKIIVVHFNTCPQ